MRFAETVREILSIKGLTYIEENLRYDWKKMRVRLPGRLSIKVQLARHENN